jgi:6-phosphogluconolactonase (cycloisomerase 2 family)
MNLRFFLTGGLFVLSEVLPFLPCRENTVLHLALSTLQTIKLIPDEQFEKFERGANIDMDHDGVIGNSSDSEVVVNADKDTVITITISKRNKK